MPVRPLVLYPDARLRLPAHPVEVFGPDLEPLLCDLADTLVDAHAIGLTGPHIGLPRRIVAVRDAPGDPVRIYVNPVLAWTSPETATHEEGSVSMPGIRERVERPARIRVAYRDPGGVACEEEAGGFAAAVLQHEIDQLDGLFWLARLSRLRRERATKRFAKGLQTAQGAHMGPWPAAGRSR